jgi:glyoxylate carboligase
MKLQNSEIIAKSFFITRSGRPGPVLSDINITKMRRNGIQL